jgi:hypothetical protein
MSIDWLFNTLRRGCFHAWRPVVYYGEPAHECPRCQCVEQLTKRQFARLYPKHVKAMYTERRRFTRQYNVAA